MNLPVTGSGFNFNNKKCHAIFFNDFDDKGKDTRLLRVKNEKEDISFNIKDPFSRKTDIANSDILMSFISINYGNVEALSEFFELNGFLFNIEDEKYSLFSCKDLFLISNRMRLLRELIDELTKNEPDYIKLIKNTAYLLLVPPLFLEVDGDMIYKSADIFNTGIGPDLISPENTYDPYEGFFLDEDTLLVDHDAWQDIYQTYIQGCSSHGLEPDYQTEFLSIMFDNIKYIDLKDTTVLLIEKINLAHRPIILDAARRIIKKDIDYHLSNITPTYNAEAFEASWDIPDLITALYFSMLFLNPNFKILKKCGNPNCINYFSTSKSNDRKIYCSESCANAVSQRKFRGRKK